MERRRGDHKSQSRVGAGVGALHYVSPSRVSPLGGVVLLLHGISLPYLESYHGQSAVLVGNATCPIQPQRSDPRGSFLACGPLPPLAQPKGRTLVHDKTVPVELVNVASQKPLFPCPGCAVTYSPALQAHASLALTHRYGAEGDVVTLVGTSEWPLLKESFGHHEQFQATVGGHDALPRYPSSDAVARSSTDYLWRVGLALPAVTAGRHKLRVALDRLWHDEDKVQP